MNKDKEKSAVDRRSFLKTSAAAGSTILAAGLPSTPRALAADGYDHRNERPGRMQYRKLGRTNFMCSALVFGCGAALRDGKAIRLLERAYDQGVNHFDVGRTYKGSEAAMAPFLKQHRGDIWVTSKGPARTGEALGPDDPLTVDYAKGAMRYWTQQLDDSLKALDTDYVDAYYLMGVNHAGFVKSEETATAFLKAKEAGKVGHFGISTHERAQECLEAAIEAGWYSLAMIAMTPSGWYDYRERQLRKGTLNLKQVRPLLDQAREAGIGLVGMKAARHIALNPYGGTLRRHGEAGYERDRRLRRALRREVPAGALQPLPAHLRLRPGKWTRRRQRRHAELQALRGKCRGGEHVARIFRVMQRPSRTKQGRHEK